MKITHGLWGFVGNAQKALQGSETETSELLGGTEENSVSQVGVID